MARRRRLRLLALACLVASGCLQVEEPPPPGALVVQLESQRRGDDSGFRSDDGWTLRVDRAVVSLGEVRLMGEECDQYSENQYLRVLDLRQAGPQKVVLAHARGRCEVGFLVRMPASDAVLGAGVDRATRDFLRVTGMDPFVENAGIALQVEGIAERDGAVVRFAWSFRQAFDYSCGRVAAVEEETRYVDLVADVGELFRAPDGADGAVRFDVFAAADADGDADVTLEELAAAPPSTDGTPFESLGEELYFGAMPRVVGAAPPSRCDFGRFVEEGPGQEYR